jgi:hypothetical protein
MRTLALVMTVTLVIVMLSISRIAASGPTAAALASGFSLRLSPR